MNNNVYPPQFSYDHYSSSVDTMVMSAMKRVYLKMTLGLIVTGIIAWFCAGSQAYWQFMMHNSWAMWALLIGEFGLVIAISAGIQKMSSATATLLFYVFAVVNGLILSSIFLAYTGESIALTFFITAGTFAAMSVYGYCTNRDLPKMDSILFMALIGLIIATVVNIFLKSAAMTWIISFVGVLIFVGLTAWDTQSIKKMAAVMPADQVGRLATLGALTLYLDFINLFLYLLRFFGNSRD